MSNQQGGRHRGAYGPGQTVLADDEPLAGGYGVPPATVRDHAPPPYGAHPPFGAPYDAVRPVGVPPPPPPARSRRRGRGQGASLVAIGAVSFLVIGSAVTAVAVLNGPSSSDDKPMPTVDVPAPSNVPPDPGAASADPPAATDPPPAPVPSYRTAPRGTPRGPRTNPRTGPPNPRYPGPGPGQRRPPR